MSPYRHTQRATLLLRIFGVLVTGMVVGAFLQAESNPRQSIVLSVVAFILAVTAFLFHSLHVEVTPSQVRIAFGPRWIRKSFPVAEITAANAVQNRWFYGWGIRYTPHGWLYNVSGFNAVEIALRSGKKYRIGTDEPETLRDAILAAMG